jgi:hypothetical protein
MARLNDTVQPWEPIETLGEWLRGLAPWARPSYDEPYVSKRSSQESRQLGILQILTADKEEFAKTVTPGAAAQRCRNYFQVGRRGTRILETKMYCDTWSCFDCATQKILPHLRYLHKVITEGRYHSLYLLTMTLADFRRSATRKALGRTQDDEFGGRAWYMAIYRTDDTVTVIITGRPMGRLRSEAKPMDSCDVFALAHGNLLALPGIDDSPSYPNGCGPKASSATARSKYVPYLTRVTGSEKDEFRATGDQIAERQYGRSHELLPGFEMDSVAVDARAVLRGRTIAPGP